MASEVIMAPSPFRDVPEGIELEDYADDFLAAFLGLSDGSFPPSVPSRLEDSY